MRCHDRRERSARVSRNAGREASSPCSRANLGPRFDQRRRRVQVKTSGSKDFRTPGLVLHAQQLGMRGVGVFGDAPPAQLVQQKLRQIYPRKTLLRGTIGVQLIQRVQSNDLDPGELVKAVRRKSAKAPGLWPARCARRDSRKGQPPVARPRPGVRSPRPSRPLRWLRFPGARVGRRPSGLLPRPYGWRQCSSAGHSHHCGRNWRSGAPGEFPADRRSRRSRETRQLSAPKSTATSTGCWLRSRPTFSLLPRRAPIVRNLIHRRKASDSPPSTGMMWPVVQGDFGPARKRIASAQSFGSIGRCVSVRLA